MFCSNCGKELAEGSNFCPDCGQKVVNVTEGSVGVQQDVRQEETIKENSKAPESNASEPKAASKNNSDFVVLWCVGMFLLGLWLGISVRPGRYWLTTIPGGIVFYLFVIDKDVKHKGILGVCAFVGAGIGALLNG